MIAGVSQDGGTSDVTIDHSAVQADQDYWYVNTADNLIYKVWVTSVTYHVADATLTAVFQTPTSGVQFTLDPDDANLYTTSAAAKTALEAILSGTIDNRIDLVDTDFQGGAL